MPCSPACAQGPRRALHRLLNFLLKLLLNLLLHPDQAVLVRPAFSTNSRLRKTSNSSDRHGPRFSADLGAPLLGLGRVNRLDDLSIDPGHRVGRALNETMTPSQVLQLAVGTVSSIDGTLGMALTHRDRRNRRNRRNCVDHVGRDFLRYALMASQFLGSSIFFAVGKPRRPFCEKTYALVRNGSPVTTTM